MADGGGEFIGGGRARNGLALEIYTEFKCRRVVFQSLVPEVVSPQEVGLVCLKGNKLQLASVAKVSGYGGVALKIKKEAMR